MKKKSARRNFIKLTTAGLGSLAFAPLIDTEKNSRTIREHAGRKKNFVLFAWGLIPEILNSDAGERWQNLQRPDIKSVSST